MGTDMAVIIILWKVLSYTP